LESWYAYGVFADRIRREARHITRLNEHPLLKALIKNKRKTGEDDQEGRIALRDANLVTIGNPMFAPFNVQVADTILGRRMTPLRSGQPKEDVNAKGKYCL